MDVETKRQELLALDKQKKALSDEAEAIISELTAEAPNGVSILLVFVRGNILLWYHTLLCFSHHNMHLDIIAMQYMHLDFLQRLLPLIDIMFLIHYTTINIIL